MKISAAAFLLGLALSTSNTLAGRTVQRKQDAVEEDRALWDRILQDAGMSLPPTGEMETVTEKLSNDKTRIPQRHVVIMSD